MDNNKLIAEFMGEEQLCLPHELKYHTSWDWLMPVIENIDHLQYESVKGIEDALSTRHIGDTHKAVVEFIKTYINENSNPR